MPLSVPSLDIRRYQELLDEALARIPVHNPEWTNFNKSDPGVTLIELFAFLTESLLYRANQIPERNRRKFLSLLGLPLQPATSARGLVTLSNERGPLQVFTLGEGVEMHAGQVPFRTTRALDVLPIETRVFYKKRVTPPPETREYYEQLYASFRTQATPPELLQYRTTPFPTRPGAPVDLSTEAIDNSLWVALLLRPVDKPYGREQFQQVREELKGRTLSLGLVPARSADEAGPRLLPGGLENPQSRLKLLVQLPTPGALPKEQEKRNARYDTIASENVPTEPTVIEVPLPAASENLTSWFDLEPLEKGIRDFPPLLEDEDQERRVITWLRITSPPPARLRLLWVGFNVSEVSQRAQVRREPLPPGTGEPDQQVKLARAPVLPGSVRLTVTVNGKSEPWEELDDLAAAGPEVAVVDPRQPPGTPPPADAPVKVFAVDPESGTLRFGDGVHGARPPRGAELRVDYDHGVGRAGNVNAGTITSAPTLPAGLKVTNPLPTWGGADAETVAEGEKQLPRHLQHRERLVSQQDFETITSRTPGVNLGRVEVLPACKPQSNEPGHDAGAVTVVVIPRNESEPPPAPGGPDPLLDAVACWLAPRRLVTTEIFVRRPEFVPLRLSVGINLEAGATFVSVRTAVEQALRDFLSPLPEPDTDRPDARRGWPLRRSVVAPELEAVVSRVKGVAWGQVRLARTDSGELNEVPLEKLQLPSVASLVVVAGEAPLLEKPDSTPPRDTRPHPRSRSPAASAARPRHSRGVHVTWTPTAPAITCCSGATTGRAATSRETTRTTPSGRGTARCGHR
ncbi:baseplate J/gp47 family protein [Archangium violaceum]|uniref:baseplate J/gp47 family protein n=1 Tax=Archangium violaceum TaxID=83451 RepID=UPI000696B017|nr:baseplate J/gp47 family protein [Archangium violaceum]